MVVYMCALAVKLVTVKAMLNGKHDKLCNDFPRKNKSIFYYLGTTRGNAYVIA